MFARFLVPARRLLSAGPFTPGILLLLAPALALPGCFGGDEDDRPDVVLVTIDTLRADHLGTHGHPAGVTPVLDRMWAEGTAFRTAIVPRGQTWPTLATVLTSQYPVSHGVRKNGLRLGAHAVTLGQVLSRAGYRCAASLGNSGSAGWPGFSSFTARRGDDEAVIRAAIRWLHAPSPQPRFLWVHLFGPHRPYNPPAPRRERLDPGYRGPIDGSVAQIRGISEEKVPLAAEDLRQIFARYDGEVQAADALLARLAREVERGGRETLWIVTADHGEELYDRNRYLSHSASVYDSVLRAPLLFRWPGRIPAGAWREDLAEAVDIAPTILALCGVDAPETFRGRALGPDVPVGPLPPAAGGGGAEAGGAGEAHPDLRDPAVSELEDRVLTLRTDRYRYVSNPEGFHFPLTDEPDAPVYPIAREELYDRRADPGERSNIAAERPEIAEPFRRAADAWREAHGWDEASRRFRGEEVPEGMLEELRALGYVN